MATVQVRVDRVLLDQACLELTYKDREVRNRQETVDRALRELVERLKKGGKEK